MDMGKPYVYGPYYDSVEYWEKLFNMECVQSGLMVIWRDLDLTLGALEISGLVAHMDSVS